LISKIDLYDVSSMFTMEQIKSTTELPLGPSASKAERPVRASRAAPKVGLDRQADAVPVSRHRGNRPSRRRAGPALIADLGKMCHASAVAGRNAD